MITYVIKQGDQYLCGDIDSPDLTHHLMRALHIANPDVAKLLALTNGGGVYKVTTIIDRFPEKQ